MAHQPELPTATFEGPTGELRVTIEGERQAPGTWFPKMITSLDLEACHLPPDKDGVLHITAARQTPNFTNLVPEQLEAVTFKDGMSATVSHAFSELNRDSAIRKDPHHPIGGILVLDMDQVRSSKTQVQTWTLCNRNPQPYHPGYQRRHLPHPARRGEEHSQIRGHDDYRPQHPAAGQACRARK